MVHSFTVPRSPHRRIGRLLGLICLIAASLGPLASSLRAEQIDKTPAQLRRSASDIVLATVETAESTVTTEGDWRSTRHLFALRVLRVDQGDLALLNTTIEAHAGQRGWIGAGLPPSDGSGHRGLPTQGDRVLVHLKRADDGTFGVVVPNGFIAAPAPTAEEIEFVGDGELRLAGTLLVPASASADRRVGGVLLLPGSGPTDRDGNQLPAVKTELLRTIAEALADNGIASLRFDKRAHARYSAEWPKDPAALSEFFGLDHFVNDAKAAWHTLREHPFVDGQRSVIVGHSEGGLIALSLGSRSTETPLRGLGLLATAGRTLDVVIEEQIVRNLDNSGMQPEYRNAILESLQSIFQSVRERGEYPATIHPLLAGLFNPSTRRIMIDYVTVDPTALARSAPGSVFVMTGDADIQVSSIRDTPPLVAALRERESGPDAPTPTVVEVVLKDVGHNLKPVAASDAMNFTGPVAPTALSAIVDWASEVLKP